MLCIHTLFDTDRVRLATLSAILELSMDDVFQERLGEIVQELAASDNSSHSKAQQQSKRLDHHLVGVDGSIGVLCGQMKQ